METAEILFQGPFYSPVESHKHTYLHKVNATLHRVKISENNQEYFRLTVSGKNGKSRTVSFNSCDLCYVEKDETEVKRRNRWSSFDCFGDGRAIVRIFSILSFVIQQQDREESITFRFLQDGEFSRHSDNGLDRLWAIMNKIIGNVLYWFGDVVDSLNNLEDGNRNQTARLVATPSNICLLDKNLKTLAFYLTENKRIKVEYDDSNSVLQIDVEESCECSAGVQNFVRIQNLKFCSRRGQEIKQKLEKLWNFNALSAAEEQLHLEIPPPNQLDEHIFNESPDQNLVARGTLVNRATGHPVHQNTHNNSNGHILPACREPARDVFPSLPAPVVSDNVDTNDSRDSTELKQYSEWDLPPPSPCNPPDDSQFVETSFLASKSVPAYNPSNPKPNQIPKGVIRSQSCADLKYIGRQDTEKEIPLNVYEDSYHYHYYKNFGTVRYKKSSMRKRIKRRSRISAEIKDVDFPTFDQHETWYDQSFRGREKDENYRRVNKIYTTVQDQQLGPNITEPEVDDPYWNSDLCLTIQRVLENKKPDLCKMFDLPFPQMTGIIIYLNVEKPGHSKDWRDLAELLGLDGQDIETIQHFCYKYREWTTEIVLIHWVFQFKRGRNVLDCCYDTLKNYIVRLERDDVLNIMRSESNDDEGSWWEENTQF